MRRAITARSVFATLATAVCTAGLLVTAAPSSAAAAPDPVTSVSIKGRTTSSTASSLTLTWTNPGSAGFAGVQIVRTTSDTGQAPSVTLAEAATGTSFVDPTVVPGGNYTYALSATDGAGGYSAADRLPVLVARSMTTTTLSGKVLDTAGRPVSGVHSVVTRGNGDSFRDATGETDDSGYFSTGLPVSGDRGYSVCFVYELGFGYPTVPQCYDGRSGTDPKHADRIVLAGGGYAAIEARVVREGRLSGTVVAVKGVSPAQLEIRVFDGDGDIVAVTHPDRTGVFTVAVPPDSDYTAYVKASAQTRTPTIWFGGRTGFGYTAGTTPYPADVRDFTVTSGRTTAAGKVTVPLAGRISGSVQPDDLFTDVTLYATDGTVLKRLSPERGTGGGFAFTYLKPGGYTLCASNYADEDYYTPQCWNGTKGVAVPRSGTIPTSAVGATVVRAGKTLAGLRFTLHLDPAGPP